jgi:HK97 family phage major capsid protein
MNIAERVLQGIKTALIDGEATVDLKSVNEASAITGSGSGIGGRTYFDDAFAAARYANPFRMGARQITVADSDVQFVAKTGNAADATNPWGYTVNPNTGSPNINTSIWQLPVRAISAQLPIRSAVLSDVNGLEAAIAEDLAFEFSQLEGQSMALNNDQTGTTTTSTGGTSGLRGIFTYPTSTTAASFGTSGTAITNGLHTVKAVNQAAASIAYEDVVNLVKALPPQYYNCPTTAWHAHPNVIHDLRQLVASTGGGGGGGSANASRLFIEAGDDDGGAVIHMFGFPVIPNPYMDFTGAGKVTLALACWDRFLTIADAEEMTIKRFDQTQVGFVTMYAEMRIASTIKDVFAGVYLKGV